MNAHSRVPLLAGLLALLAFATIAESVSGQTAGRTPVFLALPGTFPELDARAALMMEPGRDIVVLRVGDAAPETLHVALEVLARARRDHPRSMDAAQLVPITGFVAREELDRDRRLQLEAALADLRQRPLANLGNLGQGRWMRYGGP